MNFFFLSWNYIEIFLCCLDLINTHKALLHPHPFPPEQVSDDLLKVQICAGEQKPG